MKFKLSDIQPNPFRHLERYPLQPEKIKTLRESIQNTGFWDNVVARVADGSPEIAYGHHRLQALREEYTPDHEVDLIVRDLSDETMIKMMAAENMEEYKSNFDVVMETVRSVVLAYAENRILLEIQETARGPFRYSPSFVVAESAGACRLKPYTIESIENFLNWHSGQRIRRSLQALQYIEEGLSSYEDFSGLTLEQATVLLTQINQVRRRQEEEVELAERIADRIRPQPDVVTEQELQVSSIQESRQAEQQTRQQRTERVAPRVREVASTLGRELREHTITTRQVPSRAREISFDPGRPRELPDIDTWATNLARDLLKLFDPNYDERFAKKLDELQPYISNLRDVNRRNLVQMLEGVVSRVQAYTQMLRESNSPSNVTPIARRITNG